MHVPEMLQAQHLRDPADSRRRRPGKDRDLARFCVRIQSEQSMVVHEPDRRHVKDQLGVIGARLDTPQRPLERDLTCLVEFTEKTHCPVVTRKHLERRQPGRHRRMQGDLGGRCRV
jgi:hypothetical protein